MEEGNLGGNLIFMSYESKINLGLSLYSQLLMSLQSYIYRLVILYYTKLSIYSSLRTFSLSQAFGTLQCKYEMSK